jgi:hypothetical protein
MKELVKPNTVEESYEQIDSYSEGGSCCSPNIWRQSCYKYCDGGSQNSSPTEEDDILF